MSKKFSKPKDRLILATSGSYSAAFFDNLITDEKLLTKQDIANFLNVSIKMIDRKVSMNEIPYFKIGRLVRFSKDRVLAWAEESNPKG